MQQVSSTGLRSATAAERRYSITTLHTASAKIEDALVELIQKKAPQDMHAILAKPDVQLTNQKDKEAMLPKMLQMNEHVMEILNMIEA